MATQEKENRPRGKKQAAEQAAETKAVAVVEQTVAASPPPVVEVMPEQFQKIIASSGINEKKATAYLVKYMPLLREVIDESSKLVGLDGEKDEDAAIAKSVALKMANVCSRLTDQKKTDKEGVLRLGRFFDAMFNTVNDEARASQQKAKEIATAKEIRLAAEIKKVEDERLEQLSKYYTGVISGIGSMDKEVFENMLNGFKAKFEAEELAKGLAETERQLAEENLRLENEKAEMEREQEMKRLADIAAEEKSRADKLAAELKAKRLADEAAEQEKQEAINNANKAANLLKAQPIGVQLEEWVNTMQIAPPPVETDLSRLIVARFDSFKVWAKGELRKGNS